MVGYQQEDHRYDMHKGYRENYAFPDYPVLDAGGEENQKAYGNSYEWSLRSIFGRINYDYQGKYLFEANMRYDGSSRLQKEINGVFSLLYLQDGVYQKKLLGTDQKYYRQS